MWILLVYCIIENSGTSMAISWVITVVINWSIWPCMTKQLSPSTHVSVCKSVYLRFATSISSLSHWNMESGQVIMNLTSFSALGWLSPLDSSNHQLPGQLSLVLIPFCLWLTIPITAFWFFICEYSHVTTPASFSFKCSNSGHHLLTVILGLLTLMKPSLLSELKTLMLLCSHHWLVLFHWVFLQLDPSFKGTAGVTGLLSINGCLGQCM